MLQAIEKDRKTYARYIITAILVILNLTGVISLNWFIVFLLIWLPLTLYLLLIVISYLIYLFATLD